MSDKQAYYILLAFGAVVLAVVVKLELEHDTLIECYKAAQVNTNIKCEVKPCL